MGWILIAFGILMTVWMGRMGPYGSPNVVALFWGRPRLFWLAGLLGPALAISGVLILLL